MKDSTKISLLIMTTILMMVLNVALVCMIWFNPGVRQGPGRPGQGADRSEIIIRELKLDDAQRMQFEKLRDEHHQTVMTVSEKDKHTHEALFDLVKSGKENTAAADSLINEIANHRKEIERATYVHLAEVRKLCRPDQQKTFDDIIVNLFNRRPEGPPPGRRP